MRRFYFIYGIYYTLKILVRTFDYANTLTSTTISFSVPTGYVDRRGLGRKWYFLRSTEYDVGNNFPAVSL